MIGAKKKERLKNNMSDMIRCIQCDSIFTYEQLEGANHCPACGTDSLPVDPKEDVEIKINTHELRILTIWASNWSQTKDFPTSGKKTLKAILQRLHEQLPNVSLTLFDEIVELQNEGYNAELIDSDGNVLVSQKDKKDIN